MNAIFDLLGELPPNLAAEALTQSPATSGRKDSSQPSGGQAIEPQAVIPAHLDERGMADLFGLSVSMVRTKAREGIFVRSGPNRYDVRESLRRYVERLRTTSARAGQPTPGSDPDALRTEKLKLTAAQREAQEMKNAVARGELVSAEDAQRAWTSILVDVRAGLLAIPSRLPELTPEQKVQVDLEVRLALERLANG